MAESAQRLSMRHYADLSRRYDGRLRVIAKQSVTVWFNQERLDKLLAEYVGALEDCELLYAIDVSGRQISSNIHADSIDSNAYGQDLSDRPYAMRVSLLNDAALRGGFACEAYVSKATQSECITIMYGVTSGTSLMGFVAADIRLQA